MSGVVLELQLRGEQDVFLARQRAREVAALVGLENQDQVRVATALSELGRELAVRRRAATVTFSLADEGAPELRLEARWQGQLPGVASSHALAKLDGVAAARRLTDRCEVRSEADGGSVSLAKRLPPHAGPLTPAWLSELRVKCRGSKPRSAFDELHRQNDDLVRALETLTLRQDDLIRVNTELEETNQGVLALHAELSLELDQTNQGVVALYAELDEKSIELREASEAKTRFWRNVSHELRTPINAVIGLSGLLLDAAADPLSEEQHRQVQLIRESSTVLQALVNELLDVAKAESGHLEAHPELVALQSIFDQLRATLRPLALTPEVALVVEEPADCRFVWTDPVMLTRILRNVIGNGLKFTEHGEVRCSASPRPDLGQVEIVVSDTGIGIPEEHQQRVFEEFHQVPGPLQQVSGGTGLGLPYASRLAQLLGGTLGLTSEPGRGTRVALRLPLTEHAGEGSPGSPPRFGSVLIVEDDPGMRRVLRGSIAPHAGQVTEAEDGGAALRALRDACPDLVLLDLNIPPPDGRALLAMMREDPRLRDVPIVVVTSAALDRAELARLNSLAVVLDKSRLSADQLIGAAAGASRLVGETT